MATRARAFAAALPGWKSAILLRDGSRSAACRSYFRGLRHIRPDVIYVLDLTVPAILGALAVRRLTKARVILDTGDATAALIGGGHPLGAVAYPLLAWYERECLAASDAVVVRGSEHARLLALEGIKAAAVIPDGVDMEIFRPGDASEVRAALGVEDQLIVGAVGSLRWNSRLQWTTGLELVEALALSRRDDVVGLVVGQGSGLAHLRARARQYRLDNRIRFVDAWLDQSRLASYINAIDVCLSTQTNDAVGQVRTTGKLPLFLASERFVLATRVGEAARVLPDEMLLEYSGAFDPLYPARLAARIDSLASDRSRLVARKQGPAIAAAEFDYRVLSVRLARVLDAFVSNDRRAA
jgi:glycosyltransferase involved in cell wall biosynthesis